MPHMTDADDPAPTGDSLLRTAIQHAPGVGARRAQLFNKLGIRFVADLIKHLPHRYEYHAGQTPIVELPVGAVATARGDLVQEGGLVEREQGRPSGRVSVGRGQAQGARELELGQRTAGIPGAASGRVERLELDGCVTGIETQAEVSGHHVGSEPATSVTDSLFRCSWH